MEFRKADMVELHDANVVIHNNNYFDSAIGWKQFNFIKERIRMDKDIVKQLAGLFTNQILDEIDIDDLIVDREQAVVGDGQEPFLDFHSDGYSIEELEVKESERHLIIRFLSIWEEDGNKMGYPQEISYHGNYTIWWAYDPSKVRVIGPAPAKPEMLEEDDES